jgi:hypothetical protein
MRIEVTEWDIRYGLKGNCSFCPVAIAMTSALQRRVHVAVTSGQFHDTWGAFRLPAEVSSFIRAFDAGNPVEPFAFEFPG